jgi:GntR family transcriptional repressor for pyruvate dehydrogenase complex
VADPIERRNVYELVAERLLERINERGLRPGDALPTERELTEVYRVGRSSVREALRMLQSSGVISPAGKGVFVVAEYATPLNHSLHLLVTLDEANLLELFEVRKILEGETAAIAALRSNDEDLGRMGQAIEDMVAGLSAQDRYIAADLQFHLTIAASTRNRIALRMMQAIRGLLQRALASVYQIPGSPERSIEQHRTILEAVTRRDPDGARRAMLDHLLRVERDIQHTIASPPDAAAPSLVQAGRRKD